MKSGDLIKYAFWAAVVIGILIGLLRRRRRAAVTVEKSRLRDGPREHVELQVVLPSKRLAQKAEWLLDGVAAEAVESSAESRSLKTATGSHLLTVQIGVRSYEYNLECPENGRYDLYLKIDRLLGGLSKDFRVVVSEAQ